MDGIDRGEITKPVNKSYSSNSKLDKSDFDTDKSSPINKVIELNMDGVEEFCEAYIENKHIKIEKSKKMTSAI